MNNTTANLFWYDEYLENTILFYGCGPLATIGVITCLISALIFNSSKFTGKRLFSYLKFESIFMLIDLATGLIILLVRPNQTPKSPSLLSQIITKLLYYYIGNIVEMCALFSNIFVAVSCLIMLDNQQVKNKNRVLNFFIKSQPKFITLTSVLFASIIFVYEPFVSGVDGLFVIWFFKLNMKMEIFDLISFSICDGLLVLVLLVVNCLIAYKIKKILSNKRMIIGLERNLANSGKSNKRNLTKLILADCVNTIMGRLPVLVYFILKCLFPLLENLRTLSSISIFTVYVSFVLKFFIFYNFNQIFRRILFKKIVKFSFIFSLRVK